MIKKIIFIILFPFIWYFSTSAMQIIDSRGEKFDLTDQEALLAQQCGLVKADREFWEYKKVLDLSEIVLPPVTQENFQKTLSCIANKKIIQELSLNDLLQSFWLADSLEAPRNVVIEMAERIACSKKQIQQLKLIDDEIFKILRGTVKNYLCLDPLTKEQLETSLGIGYQNNTPQCVLILSNQKIKHLIGTKNLIKSNAQPSQQFVDQKLNTRFMVPQEVDNFFKEYWKKDSDLKIYSKEFDHSWLVHLDLSNNHLQKINLKKVIDAFPRLRSLDLSFNKIATLESKMFKCMPKIFYLNLSYNPIKNIDDDAVDALLLASKFSGFLKSGAFIIDLRGIYLFSEAHDVFKTLHRLHAQPVTGNQHCCMAVAHISALFFLGTALYFGIDQPCETTTNCNALVTIFSLLFGGLESYALYRPCDNYYNHLSARQHILLD